MPTRFVRKKYYPSGWEDCVQQFLKLFHRYGYIYKSLSGGSWYSANEKWKLPDSEILKAAACVHPKFFIGCRATKTTRFAVLDIDQNSRYHNKQSLDKLLKILDLASLSQSSLYRSSYSGGWHLYIFFDEPINSADLRTQLYKLLTLNDFRVAKGHLEIFPHPGDQNSLGLGLRLPVQQGFAWLDKQSLDVDYERHELSATKALELFIDALDSGSNSYSDFRNLKAHIEELASKKDKAKRVGANLTADTNNVVPIRTTCRTDEPSEFKDFVKSVFHQLPPGIIADNWYKGRLYHLNGLTGPSQRAESIECLGHYLFYGDPSRDLPALGYGYEQERQWAIEEFLHVNNNGQSKDINRGRSDAIAQVERAANWRPAHKAAAEPRKYTDKRPVSWIRANANKSADARKRISRALDELKSEDRSFSTEELRKKARCGRETLYKHDDIWRKDYEDLADGFFAACTDEYNDVVGAASSKSEPPSTSSEKFMPPGRLAARRIVYELSMRSKRELKQVQRASLTAQDTSESSWMDEVLPFVEKDPSEQTIPELKALLTVLVMYLSRAPNYECQVYLQPYIEKIRKLLIVPSDPSISVVKPP